MVLVLREADVQSLVSMPEVVQWVEAAHRAHGLAQARNVPRQRVRSPEGTLHVLPAADLEQGVIGLKCYTSFRGGTRFLVLLYSAESGRLLALVEANYLGMLRTGAASAVATKYMALPDADTLGIIGAGWQARGQVWAVSAVRKLKQVRVYSRDPARRQAFAGEMEELLGVEVVPLDSAAAAVRDAPIICTATTSREPVLAADAVAPGAHINAVGSNSLARRELDEELVRRARVVVVDSRAQARIESGDLLLPVERGWLDWDRLPELGEVVTGCRPGRHSSADITIYKSHGLGIQDLAVAAHVYERARQAGIGQELRLFDSD